MKKLLVSILVFPLVGASVAQPFLVDEPSVVLPSVVELFKREKPSAVIAGCARFAKSCKCFDGSGKSVDVEKLVCLAWTPSGASLDLSPFRSIVAFRKPDPDDSVYFGPAPKVYK